MPILQALLPNGKVLIWDSVGDGPAESTTDHSFTRALVWDPTTDTSEPHDLKGYNIFCAGYTQLADGRLLVLAGTRMLRSTASCRPTFSTGAQRLGAADQTWQLSSWYPSIQALGNNEAVIIGGGPASPRGLPDQ